MSAKCQTGQGLLTQPFLPFGDTNWYALPGGETYDNFNATGWTLSGGANIVSTKLYDGTKGYVLDMPKGAKAVSPTFCVSSNYPTAKAMVGPRCRRTPEPVVLCHLRGDRSDPEHRCSEPAHEVGAVPTVEALPEERAGVATREVHIRRWHQPQRGSALQLLRRPVLQGGHGDRLKESQPLRESQQPDSLSALTWTFGQLGHSVAMGYAQSPARAGR